MTNSERYYIQSRYESGRFLKKFSFLKPLEYTYSHSYIANIYDYPLNFKSLDSAKDYIENTLFSEFQNSRPYEISYNLLEELKGFRLVKLEHYHPGFMNCMTCYNMDNLENPLEYIRKAAFKWVSNNVFNSKFSDYYCSKSRLDSRPIGYGCGVTNDYIIDVESFNAGYNSINNYENVGVKLSNLGINFNSSWRHRLFTISDLDNLNFARLSIEDSKSWKIVREEEITNLESNIAHSQPIRLN